MDPQMQGAIFGVNESGNPIHHYTIITLHFLFGEDFHSDDRQAGQEEQDSESGR